MPDSKPYPRYAHCACGSGLPSATHPTGIPEGLPFRCNDCGQTYRWSQERHGWKPDEVEDPVCQRCGRVRSICEASYGEG